MLSINQIERIRKDDPYTYEALTQIVKAINSMARQTGADPVGIFPVTPNITSVNVTAANGLFNVQIVDNTFVNTPSLQGRAITYFVEFSTDSGFKKVVHQEAWHGVRNQNVSLGAQTLFIRAYSQLQGSAPSSPIFFGGTTPASVSGGGSAPPTQQTYQGSGTSSNSGQGFGLPERSSPTAQTLDNF